MATITEALDLARQYCSEGFPAQAEEICRQIVEADPRHAPAWCVLGVARQMQGRIAEAAESYRHALTLQPEYVDALNNLGVAYQVQQQWEEAINCHRQVLAIRPDHVNACIGLGAALTHQRKHDEAIDILQQALRLAPQTAQVYFSLGSAYHGKGQLDRTVAFLRYALQLKPDYAEAHSNLGHVLTEQRKLDEAIQHLQLAIQLQPGSAEAHVNLGIALQLQGDLEKAREHLLRSLALCPNMADALNSLGVVERELGRLDEALACYEKALHLKPDYPEAHHNRAQAWLLMGNWQQGWAEHEWRWKCRGVPRCSLERPTWDGSPLDGRTILLLADQGLGDTLHFVRYAALVKERGGRVIVETAPELATLVSTCKAVDQVVAKGSALPEFDVHASLLSLPWLFNTSLSTVPADVPYLFADASLVRVWAATLSEKCIQGESAKPSGRRLRVGFVWQGSPGHQWNFKRSIPLSCFAPLAQIDAVQLVSLQKGTGIELLAQAEGSLPIIDLGSQLETFMDTAAVLNNLDLLITADTAVAHCAGALGLPLWVALPVAPDWRWQMESETTPWYPTMRLFRQSRLGKWEDVFERIVSELRLFRRKVLDQESSSTSAARG